MTDIIYALINIIKQLLNRQMRNFIRHNIENIKGSKKPVSIERQNNKNSTIKHYSTAKGSSIQQRVTQLQKKITDVQSNYQQQIIEQLSNIREDIKLIKSHMFDQKYRNTEKQITQQSAADDEPIFNSKQRMRSQSSQPEVKLLQKNLLHNSSKIVPLQQIIQAKVKRSHSNYHKNSINLKTISSIIKQYKLQGPEFGTIFYGYSKRNSHQIIVKYAPEGLAPILQIYDRLWKNIAIAKWPCINRVVDFKRQDSSYIILEKNKGNIVGLPAKAILIDILKILQFIHDCGYLYRNIQPEHFMLNEEGQLVVIDFKRAKRYIDIKGHPLQIIDLYNGSTFASNNQLRGLPQSRKDDLQSLGYLALLLLEQQIPWFGSNKEQTIKIRSSLTLQELYKNQFKWVEYMASVMKTPKSDRPDYKKLLQILEYS